MTGSNTGATTTDATAGRMGLSRRVWWLLVASLALNLLALGAFASAAFMRRHGGHEPVFGGAAMAPGEMIGFIRSLPPERRSTIRQEIMNERPNLRSLRAAVAAARDDVGRVIQVEPLDRIAVDSANAKLWTAEGNLRRKQLELFGRMASVMTQEERANFVAWRQSRWRRQGGPDGRDADGSGPVGPEPNSAGPSSAPPR